MLESQAGRDAEVLFDRSGSVGRIVLNRPAALNSLNLNMVRRIAAALDVFEQDPHVAAVTIEGAGDRGLCAGGDIRSIYNSGMSDGEAARTFWREEYRLNARIHHFSKAYVALLDGITMGGGVGISAHGSHRVATERLRLAMPETGIGFFPDVGTTWLLSRAPGELGTYLGLTGAIIGPADAIETGLVDDMVPSDRIDGLRRALGAVDAGSDSGVIAGIVKRFAASPAPSLLAMHRHVIDDAFAYDTVEEIVEALLRDGTAFALTTAATLRAKSPTALKIALQMLRLAGLTRDLEGCLNREFSGASEILTLSDFYEGIRAAVIDKDRNPRWQPASLSDVAAADIARFFSPHPAPPFDVSEDRQNHG